MHNQEKYHFNFPLEMIEHLGKGLHRSLSTVIADAVSNAWDAQATEVRIHIDESGKEILIKDNGIGMDSEKFQAKFLSTISSDTKINNIGSTRKPHGRKGIGKFALFTISEKIILKSKSMGCDEVAAIIDMSEVQKSIKTGGRYNLGDCHESGEFNENETGTCIKFSNTILPIDNLDVIRKRLASLFNFNFSFPNEEFNIYVNDKQINGNTLGELDSNTQYIWLIGSDQNEIDNLRNFFLEKQEKSEIIDQQICTFKFDSHMMSMKGFIASVFLPSHLKTQRSKEFIASKELKANVNLFTNGRLRQGDIFRDIASARISESYFYGEIHVDAFDDCRDIFNSSRVGIDKNISDYDRFLEKLKEIQEIIISDWNSRRKSARNNEINYVKKIIHDNSDFIPDEKRNNINKLLPMIKSEDSTKFIKWMKKYYPSFKKLTEDGRRSFKKVMIVHSTKDKNYANLIYRILLSHDFTASEILYSNAPDIESCIPPDTNIFDYIREFFVQDDLIHHPCIIFVYSENMKESWYASLEAGATWVTGIHHKVFTVGSARPEAPINIDHHLFGEVDKIGDAISHRIFLDLCRKFKLKEKSIEEFKILVSKITKSLSLD